MMKIRQRQWSHLGAKEPATVSTGMKVEMSYEQKEQETFLMQTNLYVYPKDLTKYSYQRGPSGVHIFQPGG
jgi:hypothetical protein